MYFDADVIIHAIKDTNGPELERLLRVEHALRRCSTTTLYEVAFARKGDDLSRLKRNQEWINDHFPDRDRLDARVAEELERSLDSYAPALRGKADLGDALLASWCRARSSDRGTCAIATANGRDYRALPVALVRDFLPPDFSVDRLIGSYFQAAARTWVRAASPATRPTSSAAWTARPMRSPPAGTAPNAASTAIHARPVQLTAQRWRTRRVAVDPEAGHDPGRDRAIAGERGVGEGERRAVAGGRGRGGVRRSRVRGEIGGDAAADAARPATGCRACDRGRAGRAAARRAAAATAPSSTPSAVTCAAWPGTGGTASSPSSDEAGAARPVRRPAGSTSPRSDRPARTAPRPRPR